MFGLSTSERENQLEAALQEARGKLLEQDELLKQLTASPLAFGTVVTTMADQVVVISDSKTVALAKPPKLVIGAGDLVQLSAQTMQIVDIVNSFAMPGEIAVVRKLLDGMSSVDFQGAERIVYNGRVDQLEAGDRVVLDASGSIIIRNLGRDEERFRFDAKATLTWDDIGGLEEAKSEMIEAIELPHRYGALYQLYNKKGIKGALLYGPPGCGKTMLGEAVATALARLHGSEHPGFFYIKGPEILDKFIGNTEATIRFIFELARKHKEKYGYPAVIFIDEADAILGKRGSGISSDMERTIVPMFLTEMNGLGDSGAIVLLATNRPDVLDPAVVRDGRIDRKIKVGRPTRQSAVAIFELYLKKVPMAPGNDVATLSELGSSELFDDRYSLYDIATNKGESLKFTLAQICNGGMIASIVDQATSRALKRDIASGNSAKAAGLTAADLVDAVSSVFRQNRDLNHADELEEFVHDFRNDVVGIHRLRQASE